MKLRNRLMAALTLVTATVLGVSLVVVYLFVHRDELQALDQSLVIQAHGVAQRVRREGLAVVSGPGTAEVPEILDRTRRYVAVYDESGSVSASSRSFEGAPPELLELEVELDEPLPVDGVALDLEVGGHELRGVVVPVDAERRLLYAASRIAISEDVGFLVRLLPALFLIAVAATALLARWLGELLAKDVGAIASVARAVAAGDFHARVGPAARGSTETRALAAALDETVERLGTLMAAQQRFITHAAHELRSPLATLGGEIQLALRRPREPDEYRRALSEILHDVEALSRLTEDLLTLARATGETLATAGSTSRVRDIVDDALWMAKGVTERREVTIDVHDELAHNISVAGFAGDLARCLRNLVDNAVLYGPKGATVRVDLTRRDDRVCIAVSDQGPGVRAGELDRIFSPFARGSGAATEVNVGAGLGLAIAREIARAHGGSVSFDPDVSVGARVVLELPIAPEPDLARDESANRAAAPAADVQDALRSADPHRSLS